MKFVCFGYYDETKWEGLSEPERNAMVDDCLAYDEVLRRDGHFVSGEGLDVARNATTLRWRSGKVLVTDGPYAETKEVVGGILILEARDLNHALQLLSQHPGGMKYELGPIELRPVADNSEIIKESEQRRRKDVSR